MRTLCSAEIAVLHRHGALSTAEISQTEYSEIRAKTPHYVFASKEGRFYKYIVPDEVTEEALEQMERATSLDMQAEIHNTLRSIQADVSFFKTLAIFLIVIAILGVLFGLSQAFNG